MQPTHARWEQIPPATAAEEDADPKPLTNGTSHHATTEEESLPASQETIFAPVPRSVSHNFVVTDTVYTAPPISTADYPGPDSLVIDTTSGASGLSGISSDLIDELPEDCRRAFEEARKLEMGWKQQWGAESQSGLRGHLRVGFSGYPV